MMNLWSRLKTVVKKRSVAFATAGVVLAVAAGAILSSAPVKKALADAPQFNTLPQDFPALTARVNGQGAFTTSNAALNDGDYVQFMLWAHNTTLNTVATNTTVRALFPTTDGVDHTVAGQVWADNAQAVANNVNIHLNGGNGHLELDPATVHTYRFDQTTGNFIEVPTNNAAGVVTNAGMNLGDMQGCWNYMRVVTFSARVVKEVDPHILTYKEDGLVSVENTWHRDGITTSPGNDVNFHIYVENDGQEGSILKTPLVMDTLDSRLTYKPGTAYMITRDVAGNDVRLPIPDNSIGFSGQKLTFAFSDMNSLAASSVSIYFQATLAGDSAFPVGSTTITNTAQVTGNGPQGALSATTNAVTITVNKQIAPLLNASLVKVVRNITTASLWESDTPVSATPGDVAEYELRVTNTGNQVADLVVKDALPAGLTQQGSVLIKAATQPDSAFTPVTDQGLFAAGYTAHAVQPGNANGFVLRFRVVVNTDIPAGQQLLTNVGQVFLGGVLKAQAQATLLVGANSAYILQKSVLDPSDGQWKKVSTYALQPGDMVRYRIDIINTGNTDLTVDSIRDVMPQFIHYVAGSLVIDPQIGGGGTPVTTADAFFSTGNTNFRLAPGVTKRIEYNAQVMLCPELGTFDQVNTAFIRANGGAETADQATIKLTTVLPNPGF